MKEYVVYMNDNNEVDSCKTLAAAYLLIQDCKRQDKLCKIPDMKYYIRIEETTDKFRYISNPMKIYRRKNKVFAKEIKGGI